MELNSTHTKYLDLDFLPPGYRFSPLDGELLVYYLTKKIKNEPLPPNRIMEINLYQHSPEQLEEMYKPENAMYFFTQRDRKHQNGSRPNRVTGFGYWKATGADKQIKFEGEAVGFKKTLAFYRRNSEGHKKTNWIMHEFRVDSQPSSKKHGTDMKLDWVLCRIYNRDSRSTRPYQLKEENKAIILCNNSDGTDDEAMHMDSDNVIIPTEYPNPSQNALTETSPERLEPIAMIMSPQVQSSIHIPYSNANNSDFDYMHQPLQNSFSVYANTDQNAYIGNSEFMANTESSFQVQPLNFDCGASSNPNCILTNQAQYSCINDRFKCNANVYFDSMQQPLSNNFHGTLQPSNSTAVMDTGFPASNANHGTSIEVVEIDRFNCNANSYFDSMHQPLPNNFSESLQSSISIAAMDTRFQASNVTAMDTRFRASNANPGTSAEVVTIDSFKCTANVYFDSMHQPLSNNFPETLQTGNNIAAMGSELPASNANHGTSVEVGEPLSFMAPSLQFSTNPYNWCTAYYDDFRVS